MANQSFRRPTMFILPVIAYILQYVSVVVFGGVIGQGATNPDIRNFMKLYFLRIDTSHSRAAPSPALQHHRATDETDPYAVGSGGELIVYQYYVLGLWNYCAGNTTVGFWDGPPQDDPDAGLATFCSKHHTRFAFDPAAVWGLNASAAAEFFPAGLASRLSWYRGGVSQAIGPVFAVGVTAMVLMWPFGLVGFASTSTSKVAVVSAVSVLGWAACVIFTCLVCVAYYSLRDALNALEPEGIHADVNSLMLFLMLLVVALQTFSAVSWVLYWWAFRRKRNRTLSRNTAG